MSIISVRNLTFCYEGSFDNIFEIVNFTIETGAEKRLFCGC